jgi:hypothetical protein
MNEVKAKEAEKEEDRKIRRSFGQSQLMPQTSTDFGFSTLLSAGCRLKTGVRFQTRSRLDPCPATFVSVQALIEAAVRG